MAGATRLATIRPDAQRIPRPKSDRLLENHFRALAGEVSYGGDFIGEYLLAVIYPAGLTREIQIALGAGVLLLNVLVYWRVLAWRRHPGGAAGGPSAPASRPPSFRPDGQ
jgi:hypothetical protein